MRLAIRNVCIGFVLLPWSSAAHGLCFNEPEFTLTNISSEDTSADVEGERANWDPDLRTREDGEIFGVYRDSVVFVR